MQARTTAPPLAAAEAPVAGSVRARILDAAESRFRVYGFRKTTMAEIASDLDMSASNLYRFFDGKADLCRACASHCIDGRIDVLRAVARRSGVPAADRLREFTLANLAYTQELVRSFPHIHELVEHVATNDTAFIQAKVEGICALLAEILSYGNETGEFEVDDVWRSARAAHHCQVLFEVPLFMRVMPPDKFEEAARAVADLMIRGLAARS